MGVKFRNGSIESDKDFILKAHLEINYACDCAWARQVDLQLYNSKWYSSNQPNQFLTSLKNSLEDSRTLFLIAADGEQKVGYIWVRFYDIADYDLHVAEIEDVFVLEEYRHQKLATKLLEQAENHAKIKGANLMRSGTGILNEASIKLHETNGFNTYRVEFEKRI